MERSVTPEGLGFDIASKQLVDVRRPADFAVSAEMLPGAVWRDPGEVATWSQSLAGDQEIIIYCVRGGSVSNAVIDALHAKGLNARYIEGGIEGWKAAGGKIVSK